MRHEYDDVARSTALTTIPATTQMEFTTEQQRLIEQMIGAKNVDPTEFAIFLQVCQRTGLNPIARQIYAIPRYDSKLQRERLTIQTGIDGYRLLAARTGELAGIDDPTYDMEDADHPNKATVVVWRMTQGQRMPFTATARWREYAQISKDNHGKESLLGLWSKMPYLMLGKCAEALALRKAFPAELSGDYTNEEMSQADSEYAGPTVEADPHPAPAAPAAARPQPQRRPAQPPRQQGQPLSVQALFERAKRMKLAQPEWMRLKRECGTDLTKLSAALDDLQWGNGAQEGLEEEEAARAARAGVGSDADDPDIIFEVEDAADSEPDEPKLEHDLHDLAVPGARH